MHLAVRLILRKRLLDVRYVLSAWRRRWPSVRRQQRRRFPTARRSRQAGGKIENRSSVCGMSLAIHERMMFIANDYVDSQHDAKSLYMYTRARVFWPRTKLMMSGKMFW